MHAQKDSTSESRQTAKHSIPRSSESKRTVDQINLRQRSKNYEIEIQATKVLAEEEPETFGRRQLPRQIDLSTLPPERYALSILPSESREERSARLIHEQKQQDHELKKDRALFYVALSVFVVAFLTLGGLLLLSEDAANQQLARSMLPVFITSPVIAYLFRKKSTMT